MKLPKPPITERATLPQRELISRLLVRSEMIAGPNDRNSRTGFSWRWIFKASSTPDPGADTWPTVGEWMDSLDKLSASRVIDALKEMAP